MKVGKKAPKKPKCPDHPNVMMFGQPVNDCVVLWTCNVKGCKRLYFQEC